MVRSDTASHSSLTMTPILLLSVCLLLGSSAFRLVPFGLRAKPLLRLLDSTALDGNELSHVLNELEPSSVKAKQDIGLYNEVRTSFETKEGEEIHRVYPYAHHGLPVLPDCNNYYSGTYGKYFWHQNADQVFMYIPVDSDVCRSDVKVKFEAKQVTVTIRGEQLIQFPCAERIIPEGSFWIFETDKDGSKFVQLDMEKRYRMINWKGLFSQVQPEASAVTTQKRADMMEKLLAANQGMSKLSGVPPETMRELMASGELTRMIADEVYDQPQVSYEGEDGELMDEAWDNADSVAQSIDSDSMHDQEVIDVEAAEGDEIGNGRDDGTLSFEDLTMESTVSDSSN